MNREFRTVFVLPFEYQNKNYTSKFLDKFCLTQTEVALQDMKTDLDKEVIFISFKS